uniref:Costars family protein ABRACL n=2 Tax=Taeniopygia guttata TaxID=59729 RepID=H0ZKZ3_TAEGU
RQCRGKNSPTAGHGQRGPGRAGQQRPARTEPTWPERRPGAAELRAGGGAARRGQSHLRPPLAGPRPRPPLPRGSAGSERPQQRQRITMNVEHEISLLVEEIRRLGAKNADGQVSVKFGVLFADEKCANLFEALVGTLKAAKRRKIVTYQGELLLQGVHDNVDIMLLQD